MTRSVYPDNTVMTVGEKYFNTYQHLDSFIKLFLVRDNIFDQAQKIMTDINIISTKKCEKWNFNDAKRELLTL